MKVGFKNRHRSSNDNHTPIKRSNLGWKELPTESEPVHDVADDAGEQLPMNQIEQLGIRLPQFVIHFRRSFIVTWASRRCIGESRLGRPYHNIGGRRKQPLLPK